MKKNKTVLLALGLLLHATSYPYTTPFDDFDDDFFTTDSDLDNLDLTTNTFNPPYRSAESNATIIYQFFGFIDNPNAFLNTPIYQKTSPVITRSILEEPFTLTYAFDMKYSNSLSFMLFGNRTSKKNFTKDSTILESYFQASDPARLATLENADKQLSLLLGSEVNTLSNLAESLALFYPATIQETRIGGIFESHVTNMGSKQNVDLIIQLPILYAERNLYLTNAQKAAIEASPLGVILKGDNVDENDFIYQHIVMDQFGFGDIKCKVMYHSHESNIFDLYIGGFVILPTATPLKQGIIGTWFDQTNEQPYLDLTTINPLDVTTQNYDDIANFFLAAVDKLSSNVLNCPLGNNGHVILAPSLNFDWYVSENWQFSNDFSAQLSLPAVEQRFYIKTQTQANFLNIYNTLYNEATDTGDAIPFANFVSHELQNLLFPTVLPTLVYPGTVFNSTNQLVYTLKDWDFYFGSNFWYQGQETLVNSKNNGNFQPYQYDYADAVASTASQEKLFGKINYNIDTDNYSWSLSFYGDITVWNSGIGNDFTLALCADCKF